MTKRIAPPLLLLITFLCTPVFFEADAYGQVDTSEWSDPLSHHPDRGRVIRQFLPDTGPDSMAVALPSSRGEKNHAFCFDADKCRLRYAWTGGFIHLNFHKRDGPAKIQGDVFHRTKKKFPLRFGSRELETTRADREFLGFQLVDGLHTFQYQVKGNTVHHRIAQQKSGVGLIHHFRIDTPSQPVWFVPEQTDEIAYSISKGSLENGAYKLSAKQAQEFSVSLTYKENKDK